MPFCETKYHGSIEYTADLALDFPQGLLGFEEHRSFLPLEVAATRPIIYLQSLLDPQTCFITLPVLIADPDYRLSIYPEDEAALELPEGSPPTIGVDVLCLTIVHIQPGGATTANLMAPVVVNLNSRRGLQIISANRAHSHRHEFLSARETQVCS